MQVQEATARYHVRQAGYPSDCCSLTIGMVTKLYFANTKHRGSCTTNFAETVGILQRKGWTINWPDGFFEIDYLSGYINDHHLYSDHNFD